MNTQPTCTRPDWLELPDVDVAQLVAARRALLARPEPGPPVPYTQPVMDGPGPMVLEEAPPVEQVLEVDVDPGWLLELRAEHVELLEAWRAAAGAVSDARERFAREDDAYRVELRAAVRAGRDPNEVTVPGTKGEVRAAQLEVLGEEELRARRALGEFARRVINRELPAHRDMLSVVAALDRRPSPSRVELGVARAAGRLHRLAESHYSDGDNALSSIEWWVGGA